MFSIPSGEYPPLFSSITFNIAPGSYPSAGPTAITITTITPANYGVAIKLGGAWFVAAWLYKGKLSGSIVVGTVDFAGTYLLNVALYNLGTGVLNAAAPPLYTWTIT